MVNVRTNHWHKLDDGRIQCDICPRFCKLHEGQRGLCFVRACEDQEVVLTTYGRSSGFCIDPIEKKPLNHFLPGTPVLSFGTAGCNLTCKFCQNHDISKSRELDKLQSEASPKMIASAAKKTGSRSVAFTYNDPVIFYEYAIDVAKACREEGIKTIAVTAGYITRKAAEGFFSHIDAANIDLKAFSQDFYKRLCSGKLSEVLDILKYIKHETDVWLELTNLMIPGENDSEAEVEEMTQWIFENLGPDVPVHFTAFHPDWKMMDVPKTPRETLIRSRQIAQNNGIRYAYTGNIHDFSGASTYCHSCNQILIGRDWHQLSSWNLSFEGNYSGNCNNCGTKLAGVFDEKAGTWGRKRVPIRFSEKI